MTASSEYDQKEPLYLHPVEMMQHLVPKGYVNGDFNTTDIKRFATAIRV